MEAGTIFNDVVTRNTKDLFKEFLVLIEDLNFEHEQNFGKLYDNLPQKYHAIIDQANYFDDDKLQYIRKKILDIGNNSIRKIESHSEKFTISFNFNK